MLKTFNFFVFLFVPVILFFLVPMVTNAALGPGLSKGALTVPDSNLSDWTQVGVEGGIPDTTNANLWPIIEKADMLIGFNSEHFDTPLLNKYYPGDLTKIKSLDILKEIKNSLGRRIKLDTVAEATLGKKKIGHGLEAITWGKNGEIDKIIKYCLEDVKITKEVWEFETKE